MITFDRNKVSIKDLRKIPNTTWKAIKSNFGTYYYIGSYQNLALELKSYAYLSPRYDRDDDSFETKWVLYVDNKPVSFPLICNFKEELAFILMGISERQTI